MEQYSHKMLRTAPDKFGPVVCEKMIEMWTVYSW
jgi:hypothetical protein